MLFELHFIKKIMLNKRNAWSEAWYDIGFDWWQLVLPRAVGAPVIRHLGVPLEAVLLATILNIIFSFPNLSPPFFLFLLHRLIEGVLGSS